MIYVVVLPKTDPSAPLKIEIRQQALLSNLRRVSCPGGSVGTSGRTGGNLELKFEDEVRDCGRRKNTRTASLTPSPPLPSCSSQPQLEFSATPQMLAGDNDNGFDSREAIVWNLVQLKRVLCDQTLSIDGIDIEELDFLSEVHGFLADNLVLTQLLEEEEQANAKDNNGDPSNGGSSNLTPGKSPGKKSANANLFSNREEEVREITSLFRRYVF